MNRVLVILPNNLGDVIMALPVLAGLKRNDPETHITFFVEDGFEAGLVNSPFCDRIFRFNRKAIRAHARGAEWRQATAFLKETVQVLGSERIDKVVNLSQHPYTSYLTTLLGCMNSVGRRYLREGNHALGDPWSQYLYAIPFARACNSLHATDVYCRIAGVVSPTSHPVIHLDEKEKARAIVFLSENGMKPDVSPIMILQPGSAYAAKHWPLDHFAELGALLVSDGYRIIVTGAPAEQELALALGARIGNRTLVTAGKVTFRETIALLPFVSGCVTGDTAIMHAAAGLDRKAYALFGPTNPVETGPYGEGHHIFFGRCAKRPCFRMDCKNTFCMKSISPDLVYSSIRGVTVKEAECDVYVTRMRADGTVRLGPVMEQGPALYDAVGASIARRVVDPMSTIPGDGVSGADEAITRETTAFIDRINRMIAALEHFLGSRSMEAIRRYESIHGETASSIGIAAFYSALLNIRLNGIPLLDPMSGVKESLRVCTATKAAIETAISVVK